MQLQLIYQNLPEHQQQSYLFYFHILLLFSKNNKDNRRVTEFDHR